MNKIFISFFLLFSSIFICAKNEILENTRKKINDNNSVSFNTTAYYPNPETDEINKFTTFYIVNNYKLEEFDFFAKTGNRVEISKNGYYSQLNLEEKTEYKYEQKQNQLEYIKSSHLLQYGPISLINLKWQYVDSITNNKEKLHHFSFIENTSQYEGKTIKIEYNIYISHKNLISKFERKSYVDDKLGQTVTYEFSNYFFSKKEIDFNYSTPSNYSLKYFEKIDLNPLEKETKAPNFTAIDLANKEFSEKNFIGNKTLLLFSSTNCGASKEVFDFMRNPNFILPKKFKLANFYASDTKEIIQKYFKNDIIKFPIFGNRKDIENIYKISGYPIMYLVNENGIITEVFNGYMQIIDFLKSKQKE